MPSASPSTRRSDRRSLPAPASAPVASPERAARDLRHAALLSAAARGDCTAFEAFYDDTFAYARTLARRLLRGADIEDLLADTYFEAWREVVRFEPERGTAMTWLLTRVRSRALDALRARAAARAGQPSADSIEDLADPQADPQADPAEQLWRRESSAMLTAALARLSPAERWVLGLAYLRELSHAQIAHCTGMPLGSVKSHALRAQAKLRAALAGFAGASGRGRNTP